MEESNVVIQSGPFLFARDIQWFNVQCSVSSFNVQWRSLSEHTTFDSSANIRIACETVVPPPIIRTVIMEREAGLEWRNDMGLSGDEETADNWPDIMPAISPFFVHISILNPLTTSVIRSRHSKRRNAMGNHWKESWTGWTSANNPSTPYPMREWVSITALQIQLVYAMAALKRFIAAIIIFACTERSIVQSQQGNVVWAAFVSLCRTTSGLWPENRATRPQGSWYNCLSLVSSGPTTWIPNGERCHENPPEKLFSLDGRDFSNLRAEHTFFWNAVN